MAHLTGQVMHVGGYSEANVEPSIRGYSQKVIIDAGGRGGYTRIELSPEEAIKYGNQLVKNGRIQKKRRMEVEL
jgi:hypothetical protein